MPLVHRKSIPIQIDWESDTPPSAQIFGLINCLILTEQLKKGELLPQIRVLAAQLNANPNTVAKAYNQLERAGLIRKRQGSGCFVTGVTSRRSIAQRLDAIRWKIDQLVAEAAALGIPTPALIDSLRRHDATQPSPSDASDLAAPPPDRTTPALWQQGDDALVD